MSSDAEIEARILKKLQSKRPVLPKTSISSLSHKWRLSSAWQKSVRRSQPEQAIKMLLGLHLCDPQYAWRRITVLYYEDVAGFDFHTAEELMWVQGKIAWRKGYNADVRLAAVYTEAMANSVKSRFCCNASTWFTCATMPKEYWEHFAHASPTELVDLAATGDLVDRIAALRYLAGVALDNRPHRSRNKEAYIEAVSKMNVPPAALNLALKALSIRNGCDALSPTLPLFWELFLKATPNPGAIANDVEQPVLDIGGIPSYAYDTHCYEGKRAMRYFKKAGSELPALLDGWGVTGDKQDSLLHELLFCADSGVLINRASFKEDDDLWWVALNAYAEHCGLADKDQTKQAYEMMLAEFDKMNYARSRVLRDEDPVFVGGV